MHLLYISNGEKPFLFKLIKPEHVFSFDRGEGLVDVVSYCLMPNHFHIAVREMKKGGTTRYIRKLCTAYSMYYNIKYDHSGTIFQGKYKAKPVTDQQYLNVLINYIHLNPFGIDEPELMKDAHRDYMEKAIEYSKNYEYSSFKDYLGIARVQKVILNRSDLFRSDLG